MKKETRITPIVEGCSEKIIGCTQAEYCCPLTNRELEEKIYKLVNVTKQIVRQSISSSDNALLIELQELEKDLM